MTVACGVVSIVPLRLVARRSDAPLIFQGVTGVGRWVGVPVDLIEQLLMDVGPPGVVGQVVVISGW